MSEPWLSSALFNETWSDGPEPLECVVVEVTDVVEDEVGASVVPAAWLGVIGFELPGVWFASRREAACP